MTIAIVPPPSWHRRARPLLGTLVEIGVRNSAAAPAAADAAFAAISGVQAVLSRFEPASDIARFNAAPAGVGFVVHAHTVHVLQAAQRLRDASDGLFDVSLGSAPHGWSVHGNTLTKHDAAARLDLGGIAKGHAVDCAVRTLRQCGIAAGWANAGGDVRAFGAASLALQLRDERGGGVRPIGRLRDAAFASSHYGPHASSRLFHPDGNEGDTRRHHVSVSAAECLWADAITKVVAASGDTTHRMLAQFGAHAWLH